MSGRASAQSALETRERVLGAAAGLASLEGLDSVTIGRLADALGMSKSGVIGQFQSKERLQLATVERLFADFRGRVWDTVKRFEPGLPRLLAACRAWVEYAADPGYPGGCLLSQVTFDYDGRGGAVHDRLAEGRTWWRARLRADLETAIAAGDLVESTDIDMVLFGLDAVTAFITPARLIHGEGPQVSARALQAMWVLLGSPSDVAAIPAPGSGHMPMDDVRASSAI
jgi:AcrR family transcriptional regulator